MASSSRTRGDAEVIAKLILRGEGREHYYPIDEENIAKAIYDQFPIVNSDPSTIKQNSIFYFARFRAHIDVCIWLAQLVNQEITNGRFPAKYQREIKKIADNLAEQRQLLIDVVNAGVDVFNPPEYQFYVGCCKDTQKCQCASRDVAFNVMGSQCKDIKKGYNDYLQWLLRMYLECEPFTIKQAKINVGYKQFFEDPQPQRRASAHSDDEQALIAGAMRLSLEDSKPVPASNNNAQLGFFGAVAAFFGGGRRGSGIASASSSSLSAPSQPASAAAPRQSAGGAQAAPVSAPTPAAPAASTLAPNKKK